MFDLRSSAFICGCIILGYSGTFSTPKTASITNPTLSSRAVSVKPAAPPPSVLSPYKIRAAFLHADPVAEFIAPHVEGRMERRRGDGHQTTRFKGLEHSGRLLLFSWDQVGHRPRL